MLYRKRALSALKNVRKKVRFELEFPIFEVLYNFESSKKAAINA